MIQGTFDEETRRPYVQGLLVLPRLHVRGHVDFLFDTGADATMLHPADVFTMGLKYEHLRGNVPMGGLGGTTRNFQEHGFILFAETNGRLPLYRVNILIPRPNVENIFFPSLLGRDVFSRWRIHFDQGRGRLNFIVVSADAILRV